MTGRQVRTQAESGGGQRCARQLALFVNSIICVIQRGLVRDSGHISPGTFNQRVAGSIPAALTIDQVADFVSETSAVLGSRLTAVWFGMFVMVSGW
jgi:hypothetical protein